MDLVISDIHADISALDAIIGLVTSNGFEKKYGKFSRIINLGDLLERGTHPKQVLERMEELSKNYPVVSVIGNHDEAFLYGRTVSGSSLESLSAHQHLRKDDLGFFKKNNDDTFGQQEFLDNKVSLVCVHGGPLEPKKIMPKSSEDSWLYQKTWQRLTEEEFEFFSYYGYHYMASSAFSEAKTKTDNPIILCGHQHEEAALKQNSEGIQDIYSKTKPDIEKISGHIIEKREIPIEKGNSYFIRIGLGGPEGYYGKGDARPHFGIIQHDQKKAILFGINSK